MLAEGKRKKYKQLAAILKGKKESLRSRNPYRLIKSAFKKQPYGETPIFTWEMMAAALSFQQGETLIDLGAGRMLGTLYLALRYGVRVVGVERCLIFVKRAQEVISQIKGEALLDSFLTDFTSVSQKDWQYLKGKKTDWIYFYGVGLEDCVMKAAQDLAFTIASDKTKVLSVGVDWSEGIEDEKRRWKQVQKLRMPLPIGETSLYVLQKRKR